MFHLQHSSKIYTLELQETLSTLKSMDCCLVNYEREKKDIFILIKSTKQLSFLMQYLSTERYLKPFSP